MSQKPVLYHPTEIRTYGLKELAVPPQRYARFLIETVKVVKELVLQENKCQSLDEVAEKYTRTMQKLNPGKSREELDLGSPLVFWVDGELHYNRGWLSSRKPYQPNRSTEYVERLRVPPDSSRIHLKSTRKDLAEFVDHLGAELDQRFPNREGKVPSYLFDKNKRKKGTPIYDSFSGFRFGLNFQSEPTLQLQVSIRLIDFGGIHEGKSLENGSLVPAIQIEAQHLVAGSIAFPRKIVEALGEIVTNHYKAGRIEHETRYTREY